VARTSGDDAEADELIEVARGRDPERTDRFLTLLAGVLRRADLANGLEVQLPKGARVTSIQRALWTAIAEGRYGDGATDVLVTRLRAAVASTDGAAAAFGERLRRHYGGDDRTLEPAGAVVALMQMRSTVAKDVEQQSGTPLAETPGSGGNTGTTSTIEPSGEASTAPQSDVLGDELAMLVGEGAPGEEAVVARIDEARMAFSEPRARGVAPTRKPDLPERDLVTLLAEDATGKRRRTAGDRVGRHRPAGRRRHRRRTPCRRDHSTAAGKGHGRSLRRRRRHLVGGHGHFVAGSSLGDIARTVRRGTDQLALRRHRARSRRGRAGGHRRHRRDGGTPRVRRAGACCRRSV